MIYDTLIVGGGPAGIAAAIQLKRAGHRPVLLEKNAVGGLLRNANLVENYPGFPGGLPGKKLARLFQRHLARHRVPVKEAEATRVTRSGGLFTVRAGGKKFRARSLVVAAGTIPKSLAVPGESALAGKKVFYEAEEIPFPLKGKTVAVAGSGDVAFDFSLSLARRGARCLLLLRGKKSSCLPLLLKAVKKNSRVRLLTGARVEGLSVEGGRLAVALAFPARKRLLVVDCLLVAIGRKPCLGFLPEAWRKRLRRNPRALERQGICLAGDAVPGNLRYAGVAVADGLRAAQVLGRFLS